MPTADFKPIGHSVRYGINKIDRNGCPILPQPSPIFSNIYFPTFLLTLHHIYIGQYERYITKIKSTYNLGYSVIVECRK